MLTYLKVIFNSTFFQELNQEVMYLMMTTGSSNLQHCQPILMVQVYFTEEKSILLHVLAIV